MDFEIEYFETIDSTNTYLYELGKKGVHEGYVVSANHQTAGRGRSGRSFESPRGNLYMSILIRPSVPVNELHLLTPLCAVCVHRAISETFNITCLIKWVNDIYYNDKKICGILTEIGLKDGKADFAVIGIGINVFPYALSRELEGKAGFLFNEADAYDDNNRIKMIDKLRNSILMKFDELYTEYDVKNFMSYYRKYSLVIGEKVTYSTASYDREVLVVDIDDSGRLVVNSADGEVNSYYDGEISIKI